MSEEKVRREEYKVKGEELLGKIKEMAHEGNIRRIIIKDEQGKTVVEVPLTLGVIGALLLPTLAAIGAIAALASNYTLVLEKVDQE